MGHNNRRQAVRVSCEIPLRVETAAHGPLDATLVDVSRTGFRVRVRGVLLGVHRLSSLVQVARQVAQVFGESFRVLVDHERFGPLIRKDVTPIRIAQRDWEQAGVELGCLLQVPMGDFECGLLGLDLPPLEPDEPDAPGPRSTRASPRRFDAFIYGRDGHPGRPLVTQTSSVSRGMAVLEVDPRHAGALEGLDVASLVIALDDTFGTHVMLRIADEEEDIWVGPAEIKEVDTPPTAAGRVRLGVAFGRELRTEELARLGLPTPA